MWAVGEGNHTIELAKRLHLNVLGIDPVPRHIDIATRSLAEESATDPGLAKTVGFQLGTAEELPVMAETIDLVWCRDVQTHSRSRSSVDRVRRVLMPGGTRSLPMFKVLEWLELAEAAWVLPTMGCVPENMEPLYAEAAIGAAELQIDRCAAWQRVGRVRPGADRQGRPEAASRGSDSRDPDRYIQAYGQANYDIALGDCLWHVYQLSAS